MLHAAAVLIFLLGVAHSVLGERYILVRLFRRDDLPRLFGGQAFTRQTLRFAWHVTTVTWFGLAVLLWQAGDGPLSGSLVIQIIGYTSIACGVLPLLFTRGRHLSWIVFFVVGVLCLLAGAD